MWKALLPSLILEGSYRTQGELVQALADHGHDVTQASVSRELKNLGVQKVEGIYALSGTTELGAPVLSANTTAQASLAVLKTIPAHASVLAQFIDGMSIDGVLGTIAGDDTVFVALQHAGAGDALLTELRRR